MYIYLQYLPIYIYLYSRASARVEFLEAGAGRCMEAAAAEVGASLAAEPCSDLEPLQRWDIPVSILSILRGNADKKYLCCNISSWILQTVPGLVRLRATDLCVTVGGEDTEAAAGPLVRRDLLLAPCAGGAAQVWRLILSRMR